MDFGRVASGTATMFDTDAHPSGGEKATGALEANQRRFFHRDKKPMIANPHHRRPRTPRALFWESWILARKTSTGYCITSSGEERRTGECVSARGGGGGGGGGEKGCEPPHFAIVKSRDRKIPPWKHISLL